MLARCSSRMLKKQKIFLDIIRTGGIQNICISQMIIWSTFGEFWGRLENNMLVVIPNIILTGCHSSNNMNEPMAANRIYFQRSVGSSVDGRKKIRNFKFRRPILVTYVYDPLFRPTFWIFRNFFHFFQSPFGVVLAIPGSFFVSTSCFVSWLLLSTRITLSFGNSMKKLVQTKPWFGNIYLDIYLYLHESVTNFHWNFWHYLLLFSLKALQYWCNLSMFDRIF